MKEFSNEAELLNEIITLAEKARDEILDTLPESQFSKVPDEDLASSEVLELLEKLSTKALEDLPYPLSCNSVYIKKTREILASRNDRNTELTPEELANNKEAIESSEKFNQEVRKDFMEKDRNFFEDEEQR